MPDRPGEGEDGARAGPAMDGAGREAEGPPAHPRDPFDLWLRRQLHDAFDHVRAEPIPEDILRLIEEDRAERERIRAARPGRCRG